MICRYNKNGILKPTFSARFLKELFKCVICITNALKDRQWSFFEFSLILWRYFKWVVRRNGKDCAEEGQTALFV